MFVLLAQFKSPKKANQHKKGKGKPLNTFSNNHNMSAKNAQNKKAGWKSKRVPAAYVIINHKLSIAPSTVKRRQMPHGVNMSPKICLLVPARSGVGEKKKRKKKPHS